MMEDRTSPCSASHTAFAFVPAGPDLAFIDHLAFLRSRMTFTTAVTDPFLIEVTSDGVVIEEASTCDLRRGGWK